MMNAELRLRKIAAKLLDAYSYERGLSLADLGEMIGTDKQGAFRLMNPARKMPSGELYPPASLALVCKALDHLGMGVYAAPVETEVLSWTSLESLIDRLPLSEDFRAILARTCRELYCSLEDATAGVGTGPDSPRDRPLPGASETCDSPAPHQPLPGDSG